MSMHDPDPSPNYPDVDEPPNLDGFVGPIDWTRLSPDAARAEWHDLDRWVKWLKTTYGLPPSVLPPLWHRHSELVWELSALHTHWRNCYHPDASASAPCGWHRDFAEARYRLRGWVSTSGTRVDRDRPTRQIVWPGEPAAPSTSEVTIVDRDQDFREFVADDVRARHRTG